MKKCLILFLKIIILFTASGALIWMIKFPQLEGRAVSLDLISIYTDPLIIYGFIVSISFYIGLYQIFKLLNFIDANKIYSQGAVNALKNIKLAFLILIGFIILGVIYIRFFVHGDDPTGPTMLGILVSLIAAIIITAAAVFQKKLNKKLRN